MIILERAIQVLARIEIARFEDGCEEHHAWYQGAWGEVMKDRLPSDMVIDESTGEAVGIGVCGTSKCFAGWGLTLAGVKMVWTELRPGYLWADRVLGGGTISDEATYLFGLHDGPRPGYIMSAGDEEDEDRFDPWWDYSECFPSLFSVNNTLDDLYRQVAERGEVEESDLRLRVSEEVMRQVNTLTAPAERPSVG